MFPRKTIICGWKHCNHMFINGIDMNQHILLSHMKYIKCVDVEQAVEDAKLEEKLKYRMEAVAPDPTSFLRDPHPTAEINKWLANRQRLIKASLITETSSSSSAPSRSCSPDIEYFSNYNEVHSMEYGVQSSTTPSERSQVPDEPANGNRPNEDGDEADSNGRSAPRPSGSDEPPVKERNGDKSNKNVNAQSNGDQQDEADSNARPGSKLSGSCEPAATKRNARNRSNENVQAESGGAERDKGDSNGRPVLRSAGLGEPAVKKAKFEAGERVERIPWAMTQNTSHIPTTEARMATPYLTIAEMAHAIREELKCRRTLRKKNSANGTYCVVCLDYRNASGLCDAIHNRQHTSFVNCWEGLYGGARVSKQSLLIQLNDMQSNLDSLPLMPSQMRNNGASPSR